MKRPLIFMLSLIGNCLFALSIAAQSTQTPTKPANETPTKPAATQKPAKEGEQTKNEVELALEEAKKRGEPVLMGCTPDCGEGGIEGDVLNGRALSLPRPPYPPIARAVHAGGSVKVQVIIDIDGTVSAAAAIDGHPLLRAVSVAAARHARFTPTLYEGKLVKVTGVIEYAFVLQ